MSGDVDQRLCSICSLRTVVRDIIFRGDRQKARIASDIVSQNRSGTFIKPNKIQN
jgi:hypothetical protein